MSRAFAAFGVGMAAVVGITTSYVTFQPELQRQREEREGTFQELNHEKDETQISRAILSDFQEAKAQAMDTKPSGPAWKLRRLLFGGPGGGETGEAKTTDAPTNKGEGAKREG